MINSRFWNQRPVLVTGATGLLGSWVVKALVEAGADIVCLVRDWVPQSELVRTGMLERIKVIRGDVTNQSLL
jgi:CDP-glucose 4,6-dehydratase